MELRANFDDIETAYLKGRERQHETNSLDEEEWRRDFNDWFTGYIRYKEEFDKKSLPPFYYADK